MINLLTCTNLHITLHIYLPMLRFREYVLHVHMYILTCIVPILAGPVHTCTVFSISFVTCTQKV